jgi:hypothetical protein
MLDLNAWMEGGGAERRRRYRDMIAEHLELCDYHYLSEQEFCFLVEEVAKQMGETARLKDAYRWQPLFSQMSLVRR